MKPLISICIPTYNRVVFLDEAIRSIVSQFNNDILDTDVEIIISDNCSTDSTKDIVEKYQANFKNLKYFKNDTNIGMVKNLVKVATYASGEYIWFFSDDDKHDPGSIVAIIDGICKYKSDVIFCNTKTFVGNEIVCANNFRINRDIFLKSKKELFCFISKHFYCSDFFFTFFSNYIIKSSVFNGGLKFIEEYNSSLDLFPFLSPIYYNRSDFSFLIISKPIILYRKDNASWGPAEGVKREIFTDKLMENHYKNILRINKQYISFIFIIKFLIRAVKRKIIMISKKLSYKI